MLDHNEKPFIHLKAQAFVCPFLFEMIFTDLALRVINPFIIKTVLKSSDTSDAEPKLRYSQVLRGGQISEISHFRKTVGGGRSRGARARLAGLQQFVTFPGNLNILVLRGSARPGPVSTNVEITIAPRFSAKTDILLVLRPGAGRAQPGGRGRPV